MMLMFVLKLWGYKKCFYHMYPALLWTHLADFQGILLHNIFLAEYFMFGSNQILYSYGIFLRVLDSYRISINIF